VCLLIVSQAVADGVQDAAGREEISSWAWATGVQYVICVALLWWFDSEGLREALSAGAALLFIVRFCYFLKRIPKD
jgi:hypothetical protein